MNSQQTAAPFVETDNITSEDVPAETEQAGRYSAWEWGTLGWVAIIHLGLLAAPFYLPGPDLRPASCWAG